MSKIAARQTPLYVVKDWGTVFENNRTRELKEMRWVPIPNDHDGNGYSAIMELSDGPAIYGAWVALLQIASKCTPRGVLLRCGKTAHTPQSLARMSRMPATLFERMISVVSSSDVRWLEITTYVDGCENPAGGCENPADSCDNPAEGCVLARARGMEGNGMEGKSSTATRATREPQAGPARKEPSGADGEGDFISLCKEVFDAPTMSNWGGLWRKRYREKPGKAVNVLLEVRAKVTAGEKVGNRGGYADDLWARWP